MMYAAWKEIMGEDVDYYGDIPSSPRDFDPAKAEDQHRTPHPI